VRELIQVLLSTRPGEQLMRPGVGAGLENLLTEPNTVATRARIKDLVEDALKRWEQRIVVDGVAVDPVSDTVTGVADGVRVEIAYRHKRTGSAARVGLTLVMEARNAQ
jgi:phage baseplate assembly protein W